MERKATTVFQAFTDARYKKNFGSFSYVMEEKKEEEKVGVDTNRGLFFFYIYCRHFRRRNNCLPKSCVFMAQDILSNNCARNLKWCIRGIFRLSWMKRYRLPSHVPLSLRHGVTVDGGELFLDRESVLTFQPLLSVMSRSLLHGFFIRVGTLSD